MKRHARTLRHFCLTVLVGICAVSPARADVISDWNDRALAIGGTTGTLAMVHLAMFDAITAIHPRFVAYLRLPVPPTRAVPEAAAAVAAHGVLLRLFPGRAAELDTALSLSLAVVPESPGKTAGIQY